MKLVRIRGLSLRKKNDSFLLVVLFYIILANIGLYFYLKLINYVNVKTDAVIEKICDLESNIECEMRQRRHQMRNACEAYVSKFKTKGGYYNSSLNPWEYIINQEYHLVWCNVFKSGSTSWLTIFNSLRRLKSMTLSPLELARTSYPRTTLEELRNALKTSISFIVGRHPFERLVSAYRDKLLHPYEDSKHDAMGKAMILLFGEEPEVNRLRQYNADENPFAGLPKRRPNFKEFIQFVIRTGKKIKEIDIHWAPVYHFCTPCQVNFSYIIKMETFDRDQEYILSKAKILELVGTKKENVGRDGPTSEEITKLHFRNLTKEIFDKILNLYKFDFELFAYPIPTFEDYLKGFL